MTAIPSLVFFTIIGSIACCRACPFSHYHNKNLYHYQVNFFRRVVITSSKIEADVGGGS